MEPQVRHAGKLDFLIFPDREAMGRQAASDAAETVRTLLKKKGCVNIIFAAAPSQNETLEFFLREENLDFKRINAFHMDEYVGLARNEKQSFGNYLYTHLFSKADFGNVSYISGTAIDTDVECRRYASLLRENPPDIVFCGIGENGHLAFNDPHVALFHDSVLVKTVDLDETCRMQQVHDGCFPTLSAVPRSAYTLTIPALIKAPYIICTVPAATKAEAVRAVFNNKITVECPATILKKHPHAKMYLDSESAKYII